MSIGPEENSTLDQLQKLGEKTAESRTTAKSQPNPQPTQPPVIPGLDALGAASPDSIYAAVLAAQAVQAANGETKDGARVKLTRDVIGAKKFQVGETFQSDPRYKPPLDDLFGKKPDRVVFDREVVQKGRIDEEDADFSEYMQGGFINNNNERINDAVITAAEGDPSKYEAIFNAAVREAAVRQSAGESRMTVEEVLKGYIKDGLPDGVGGSGGGGGSQAFTNVQTSIDLTNEGQARRIVNNALTGALGREASSAETRAFMKALNMNERENPTVTTTKGVASAGGTTSSSTSEGGFDSLDFADRFAKSQEGYAEYQAATTYLDSFIDALESDSRVI